MHGTYRSNNAHMVTVNNLLLYVFSKTNGSIWYFGNRSFKSSDLQSSS